jgi:hypothetical protein
LKHAGASPCATLEEPTGEPNRLACVWGICSVVSLYIKKGEINTHSVEVENFFSLTISNISSWLV